MQDIVFYAVANETLGSVRDYANARKKPAPVLTLGVSVCLRMRLFAAKNDVTPYPIDSFRDITDWQWCMDDDFEQDTTCKLVADSGGISVHTASETFDGNTLAFTEFVIPITDMNTQELVTWIGNERKRSGLTGELVGYNSTGHAVFVLQIENFTIRNRVAGLGSPTALDQEAVTRIQAERLISTAVSASAATKQDKLNSSNAGAGISITSNGVISTANVPQSVVTGLSASLAAKQDCIAAGDLVEIVGGSTVNRKRYMNIIADSGILTRTITVPNGTATVSAYVLEPGNAYKIRVTSAEKWLATTAAFKASSGTWGIEGHIELFVAGTGYVRTDSNVVLANALEPDAVNNCTVRFHDGIAIISVEDHVAGYVVTVNAASGAGSLNYALATATNEYISIDASLNGQTLDLAGATTYAGEKHVVGNGYTETIVSGGIVCTSKTTFSNLSMAGVAVSSGMLIMGDVYIPNGATVAANGGRLAIEKVTGNGGVIDLGSSALNISGGASAIASSCIFSGYQTESGTGRVLKITGNGTKATFNNCTFPKIPVAAAGTLLDWSASLEITGCTYGHAIYGQRSATLSLSGRNTIHTIGGDSTFITIISSGAIIDLTGNTNAVPIAPRGGVTFAEGGATVQLGAAAGTVDSSYMLDNVTLPAGAKLTNTAVVDLGGTNVYIGSGTTASVNGCNFTSGLNTVQLGSNGGGFLTSSASVAFTSCSITGCTATRGGAVYVSGGSFIANHVKISSCFANAGRALYLNGGQMTLESCELGANSTADNIGAVMVRSGGQLVAADCSFNDDKLSFDLTESDTKLKLNGSNAIFGTVRGTSGTVTISSGAIVDLTGNTNAVPIAPGGGITIYGGSIENPTQIYGSEGSATQSRPFAGCTLIGSAVTNLGTISGATISVMPESCEIGFIKSGESTISSTNVQVTDIPYVLETEQGNGAVLVSVIPD